MRFRPLAVLSLVALVALAGACGGGAKLSDAPLRLSDFPAGWTSSPVSGAGDRFDRQLATCLHVPATTFSGGSGDRSVTAPTFSKPGQLTVAQRVTVRGSEAAARKELALFANGGARACAVKILGDSLRSGLKNEADIGAKVGKQTVASVKVPSSGDERVAFDVVQPVTVLSTNIQARMRLVVLRKGRGVSMLIVQANGVPIPQSLSDDLVKSVADRLPSK